MKTNENAMLAGTAQVNNTLINDDKCLDFEQITILTTSGALVLAKTWLADGSIKDYDGPKYFTLEERPATDLRALHIILEELRERRCSCVIRGRLRDTIDDPEARPGFVLRRKSNFQDTPRSWVMFDIDGYDCEWAADPAAAFSAWVKAILPAEFHAAAFVWQLSGSAGRKPGLRGHVWFWLRQPLDSVTLRVWATIYEVKVDRSVLDSVQVHYTADPIMGEGVADPIWDRMDYVDGQPDVLIDYDPARVMAVAERSLRGLKDPREKTGLIGAFCRAFSPADVLNADWFTGNFEQVNGERWSWRDGGGAQEGVRVTKTHLINVHNSAPQDTISKAINAFDVVRLYMFGHLDIEEDSWSYDTPQSRLSYKDAKKWAESLPEVVAEMDHADERTRRVAQLRENERIGEGEHYPVADVIDLNEAIARFVFLSDGSRVADTLNPGYDLAFSDWASTHAASKVAVPQPDMEYKDGTTKPQPDKKVPVSSIWMTSPMRKTVVCRTFKAGGAPTLPDPEGRLALNSWKPFDRNIEVKDPGTVSLFLNHVDFLFGEDAPRFLDWLAHIEQQPGVLPHTAWLHIARNFGMGRNWLASVLVRVWAGSVAANVELSKLLNSEFNGRLSRKILAIVDEIREGARDSQWQHAERLKSILTEEHRLINPKYGRQSIEFNSTRWLLFSNHLSALPLEAGDRRIEVVFTEAEPRGSDYYAELYRAMADQQFIAAVANFLRNRDITNFNPGVRAVYTEAKCQATKASQSPAAEICQRVFDYWPSDVIPSATLAQLLDPGRGTYSSMHRRTMEQIGFQALDRAVKISGVPTRVTVIRNKEKWLKADAHEIRAEIEHTSGGEWCSPETYLLSLGAAD